MFSDSDQEFLSNSPISDFEFPKPSTPVHSDSSVYSSTLPQPQVNPKPKVQCPPIFQNINMQQPLFQPQGLVNPPFMNGPPPFNPPPVKAISQYTNFNSLDQAYQILGNLQSKHDAYIAIPATFISLLRNDKRRFPLYGWIIHQ